MAQQQFKGHLKTVLDDPKFKLTCPPLTGQQKKPQLHLYYNVNDQNPWNSAPRMVVWLNDGAQDPKNSKITAHIDMAVALSVLEAIMEASHAAKPEDFTTFQVQTKRPKDFKKPTGEKINDAKIVVGVDDNGVFLSLLHWNTSMTRLKFYFGFDDFHAYVANAEKGQTVAQFSRFTARGWARAVMRYMTEAHGKYWKPYQRDNNGGGGGYGNNNGGGGNSYNNDSSGGDDFGDLDF